ncbi:acyl-CoA dehydrogenase family protein [Streptomyces sp. NPDC002920]
MDLNLSPATKALLADLREWSMSEIRPLARETDRSHTIPEAAWKALRNAPLQTSPFGGRISYPDKYEQLFTAGKDGPYALAYACAEEMVYGDVLTLVLAKGNGIGGKVVRLMGNPDQITHWADGLDRGEFSYSGFALTEPQCGSDAAALTTSAVRDGDQWVINGHKQFCTGGVIADYIVVFATIDPGQRSRGIRGFVVPKGTPGLTILRANENKMGSRVFITSELALDDVRVPAENMLGWPSPDESGFVAAMNALNTSRASVASMAAGIAQASVDQGRQYLKANRTGFSVQRAARFEDELGRMDAAIQTCRYMSRRTAWKVDHGLPHAREASLAKAYAPPVAEKVIGRVLQWMGPDGYSEDYLVEKWYRDIKIQDIWEGTGNIQRIIITRTADEGGIPV